jgi:hypothetical protein
MLLWEKFKKKCVGYLQDDFLFTILYCKSEKAKISYWGLSDGVCRLNLKSKKTWSKPQIYQSKQILFLLISLIPQKWKGATNLLKSYLTKLASSTQNPKKIYGILNQLNRTKIFPR